jgi:uroporphyrinogen decarboxylase
LKSRERMDKALRFEETDRPPHFENGFDLIEETFGMRFPTGDELYKATKKEREKLYGICAEIYAKIIEKFRWDAVTLWHPGSRDELQYDFIPFFRKFMGEDFPVFNHVWSSFVSLETVNDYMDFSIRMVEEPEEIHKWATSMLEEAKVHAQKSIDAGIYGIVIANDSAFNSGPFLSPAQHGEFCAPYVKELIDMIKKQGVKVGYHTDGNLMKILDQILDMGPDFLHSIDPMAGMDIKLVKELTYKKMALMGNVQCNFLQDCSDERIVESAKYCLDYGTKGGGYIFSTSNIIFKGMPIKSYEKMLDYYWKRYGVK